MNFCIEQFNIEKDENKKIYRIKRMTGSKLSIPYLYSLYDTLSSETIKNECLNALFYNEYYLFTFLTNKKTISKKDYTLIQNYFNLNQNHIMSYDVVDYLMKIIKSQSVIFEDDLCKCINLILKYGVTFSKNILCNMFKNKSENVSFRINCAKLLQLSNLDMMEIIGNENEDSYVRIECIRRDFNDKDLYKLIIKIIGNQSENNLVRTICIEKIILNGILTDDELTNITKNDGEDFNLLQCVKFPLK